MEYTEELFNFYVNKYGDMVFRIARLRTGSDADAEDVTQNVFVKLFTAMKANRFNDENHVRSWLATVAVHSGVSFLREAFNRKRAELTENIAENDPEYEKKELLDCIYRLDKKYSSVIYLFYYERFSVEEIAKFENTSVSNIKVRLSRARQMLKEMLTES